MNNMNSINKVNTQRKYDKNISGKFKLKVEDEIDNYLKKYQRLLSSKAIKIKKSKKSEDKNKNVNKIDNNNWCWWPPDA